MENNQNFLKKDEVDLKEVFKIFGRRKWWFIASIIVVLILGIIYTFLQPVNCQVVYQIDIEESYANSNLSKLYPGSELSLNYFTSENIPSIFKSTQIFESLKNLPEKVDYGKLLNSDNVTIKQGGESDVFTIKVSNSDGVLANKIALTLINNFDGYIRNKNKEAPEEIPSCVSLREKEGSRRQDRFHLK